MRDLYCQRASMDTNCAAPRKALTGYSRARGIGGERAEDECQGNEPGGSAPGAPRAWEPRGTRPRRKPAGANDGHDQHRQQRHGDGQMCDDDERVERKLHRHRTEESSDDDEHYRPQCGTEWTAPPTDADFFP